MAERMQEVFFYGLFMDRETLVAQGYHPGPPRTASLAGYELRIAARATLVPAPGRTAWGVTMSLPAQDVKRLYSAPSVTAYGPEEVSVKTTDGTEVPALCYILPPSESLPGSGGSANHDYARKLAALASRIGLPGSYLAEIAGFI